MRLGFSGMPTLMTFHSQLGQHFIHTSSVSCPAAGLSPALKVLSLKIPKGSRPDSFSTLQPHEDCESDIDGVVNHRDWITASLAELSSFLFELTYPLFIILNPGLASRHLP